MSGKVNNEWDMHTFKERDRIRKSLVALSGLLFAVMIINGIVGLFGVQYASRRHLQDLVRSASYEKLKVFWLS